MNPLTRRSLWRTQNGIIVAVADMHDNHVLNIIRVLRGYSPLGTTVRMTPQRRREWLNLLANEAYRRGLTIDILRPDDPVHK